MRKGRSPPVLHYSWLELEAALEAEAAARLPPGSAEARVHQGSVLHIVQCDRCGKPTQN